MGEIIGVSVLWLVHVPAISASFSGLGVPADVAATNLIKKYASWRMLDWSDWF